MQPNPFASDFLRIDRDEATRPQRGVSYAAGPTAQPLQFITLPTLLEDAVAARGGRDAVIFAASGTRWSWHDLQRRADEVAAGLLALGLQPGERIGIWGHACEEWLCTFLGAVRIGAIAVTLDPAYDQAELEHALNRTQCRALVAARAVQARDTLQLLGALLPELNRSLAGEKLRAARVPRLRYVVVFGENAGAPGVLGFRALRKLGGPAQLGRVVAVSAAFDADQLAGVRFASARPGGGAPAAAHTHFSLVNSALHAANGLSVSGRDRVCIAAPLHHGVGLVLGVLACVASGATMVVPASKLEPEHVLRALEAQRCSHLVAKPGLIEALLDDARGFDLSALQGGLVAGGRCSAELLQHAADRLHLPAVLTSYGMTESNHIGLQPGAADPIEQRASSAGRVQPHTEVKVVNADDRIVRVGETGELCLRGYHLLRGYWQEDGSIAAAADAAGWLRTGDRAVMNGDGACRIVGKL
jgi:fatty-acyl-CoA synthase